MRNDPIKQHTVPNTYLKRFADSNGYTWVYDRERKQLRSQRTRDTTIEKDFYTFTHTNGEKDYRLEKFFSDLIERQFDPIVHKLELEELLTSEDYTYLSAFVTFQWLRSTAARRDYEHTVEETIKYMMKMKFRNNKTAQMELDNYQNSTGKQLNISAKEATNSMKENYKISVPREYHIQHIIDSFETLDKELFDLNWLILHADRNDFFITSDNPFYVLRPKTPPLIPVHISHGEVTLPLTPKLCLYMHGKGKSFRFVNTNKIVVENINKRTMYGSDRYIISRKRSKLADLIKSSKINSVIRKPSIVVETP